VSGELPPGAILPGGGPVEINPGGVRRTIPVTNTGAVPVQLTSYFHVFEANPALCFDRRQAFGMRPDVPVGSAVRVEPGETVDLPLVPFAGHRVIYGFNGLVNGPLDEVDVDQLFERMVARGFCHRPANTDTGA
jgi:urease beta subunit